MEEHKPGPLPPSEQVRVSLFTQLATPQSLTSAERRVGWVVLYDVIVEIELVGPWTAADRGPKLSRDLATEADMVTQKLADGKELLVLGAHGPIGLRPGPGLPVPAILILDRFIVQRRTPSGHADGRLDLCIRRG